MPTIDLRSDFVARPVPAMVEAMVRAAERPGGFGPREDETVSRLEALAASMLGKQDALFVPTCTMANQIAIHLGCAPGDVFVTEQDAHVVTSEAAACAALSGVMPRFVRAENGVLDPRAVDATLTHGDAQRPETSMVLLENTHVRSGGRVVPLEAMRAVRELAADHGATVHLDGARLFNAAIALGCPVADIAVMGDTVSFNLNKGLGAPLGAILAGSRETIERAVRVRQMFGGGWRPAGIPAAAGIVALETMVDRLAKDHAHARRLAAGLAALDGIEADPDATETNIVLARPTATTPEELARDLARQGVLVLPFAGQVRLVTHHEITTEAVESTLAAFRTVLAGG